MISLDTFKKSLGEKQKFYTEDQTRKLYEIQYKVANALFDMLILKGNDKEQKAKVVVSGIISVHKIDGNVICNIYYGFTYAYAY